MTPGRLMIRGVSQEGTSTVAGATKKLWYELEYHDGSEQLDDKINRPVTAAAEATRKTRSTSRTEQDHHQQQHHKTTRRMLEMSSHAKQLLVRVKRPSPSAKFSYVPAEIIKCQIETRRQRRRRSRIRRGAPPLVRLAALSVLISLIQCITLIACSSAQRLATEHNLSAQNSQQRPTITTTKTDTRETIETSQQQQQLRLEDPLLVTHLNLHDGSGDGGGGETSESRLAQVAAIRAPFTTTGSRHEDHFNNGRLVDSIAEPLLFQQQQPATANSASQQQQQEKLNYIIDFLRQNRLTKFCDLLQNGDSRIRELINQLNSMKQFTLFVPTNEALLLMSSSQLESIESSPEETRQFLMAHATGELVVPRLTEPTGQSLAQLTSKYTPAGAQNRWSSGRPLERIVQPAAAASGASGTQTLLYSLAGSPLRIITTPVLVAGGSNQQSPGGSLVSSSSAAATNTNTSPSTKLELIVNGANVLSGHSHALQEPNNTSVTYAIVHLIDRPLYPTPKGSLFERIQQVAPRFGRLIQAAQDANLMEQLRSSGGGPRGQQQLITAFVPNDDAFRSIPTKLLDQLETNRTYLRHFLRTHLVEGLFFSGQLARPLAERGGGNTSTPTPSISSSVGMLAVNSVPRLLTSMSGVELEFETKVIQSRQLILVNSIPILDQDQVVLNGVLHVIVRPIFERHLLDVACNCESSKLAPDNQTSDLLKRLASETLSQQQQTPNQHRQQLASAPEASNNWFQSASSRYANSIARNELGGGGGSSANGQGSRISSADQATELEREESQSLGTSQSSSSSQNKIFRGQRSENLVARNNRDFYRPSAAPANLALQPAEVRDEPGQRGPSRGEIQDNLKPSVNNIGRGFISATNLTTGQSEQSFGRPIQHQQNWANTANQRAQPPTNDDLAGASANPQLPSESSLELRLPSSFEVERYKIIMDANLRQSLREQQQRQQQQQQQQQQPQVGGIIMSSSLNKDRPAQPDVFAYDQPLGTPATVTSAGHDSRPGGSSNLWTYSNQPALPTTTSNQTQPQGAQLKDQVSPSASTQRHQRLLKFQAEDARDGSLGGGGGEQALKTSGRDHYHHHHHHQFDNLNSSRLIQQQQQAQAGKTVAPPSGGSFNGCAFYDTECKRLQMGGKFVRLPARPGGKFVAQPGNSFNQTSANQQQVNNNNNNQYPLTTPSSAYDSSFGETTTLSPFASSTHSLAGVRLPNAGASGPQHIVTPPQHSAKNYMSFNPPVGPNGHPATRLSLLNQLPLPPWGTDEQNSKLTVSGSSQQQQRQQPAYTLNSPPAGAGTGDRGSSGSVQGPNVNWRAQDVGDLSRIKLATGKLQQINSTTTTRGQQGQSSQQVLLVPVEMFQDSNITLSSGRPRLLSNQNQTSGPGSRPIYFAPPSSQQQQLSPNNDRSQPQQQQQQRPSQSGLMFQSNSQFFTPNVHNQSPQNSVQGFTGTNNDDRQAPRLTSTNTSANLARLTNFTTIENNGNGGSTLDLFDASSSGQFGGATKQQSPSSVVRINQQKQREVSQPIYMTHQTNIDLDNQQPQRPLLLHNESFQSAIQQARKIVRLQTSSPYQQQQQLQQPDRVEFGLAGQAPTKSDISITSAKLTRPGGGGNFSTGGLAVQASNQSPDVSGLTLARPPLVSNGPQQFGGSVSPSDSSALSQDFFQNRTIAEIMDDSGLRIDGQQVTFSRLRDCLDQADLSNLIVQQGSALTIFMPTDIAFQRLVQQQALMQQRTSRSSNAPIMSSRLSDPSRRHLLPLVARAGSNRPDTSTASELARLQADPSSSDSSSLALAQRLTLDCSTQQVRQLLLDHLSAQLITPKQLNSDLVLGSLSGKRLLLSSVPSKKIVVVDGQPVIAATRAKNGMVYVVNKFLNISQQVPNVIDLLESQPNLKTFKSYLAFASLTDRLKRETGPITILAPTNEAFDQLSSAARQLLNSDPAAMMDILRGHIIEGAQFGKLISMRNRLKTLNSDHFIEAKVIKPNIYQLDNQMTSMRLVGTSGNGVVNAIDRLIVPPWLRVSSSSGGAPQQSGVGGARSALAVQPERPSFNELDVESRNLSPSGGGAPSLRQSAGLNLPLLNNRPLRFEQPTTARLAPTNSFALTGGSTPSPNNGDGFDGPLLSSGPILANRRQPFEPTDSGNDSPFLRVANNSINQLAGASSSLQTPPAGGRLSGDLLNNNNNNNLLTSTIIDDQLAAGGQLTTSNSTKNMRLIEKLAGLMKARKFMKYLVRSRLSELLKPDMNYVILVPTDQAIERLPKQIIDVLERDPDRLSDLVNFHVLDTTFEYINTIPDGQTLNTLNEKDILFNWHRNNTILTASGAVVLGGIQEENIALLIVDRVLYPTPGDLLSIVTKSPILSNFTNLIRNAGLERQLTLAGPFTLFAPSDFAFNQLDKRDLDFLQNNRDSARRFLLRHLSQPAIFTSSIALSNTTERSTNGTPSGSLTTIPLISVTNSLGEDLVLRQKNDYFSVNEVNFSYADVAATNGVVHVIDGLL